MDKKVEWILKNCKAQKPLWKKCANEIILFNLMIFFTSTKSGKK